MNDCHCCGTKEIDQKELFINPVETHRKNFDTYGLFTASEFRKYERAIEKWFVQIIRNAVNQAIKTNPSDPKQLVNTIRGLIATGAGDIPPQIIDTIVGQFQSGVNMGIGQLPAGFVDELRLPNVEEIVTANVREMGGFANDASSDALSEIIGDSLRTGDNLSTVSGKIKEWANDNDQVERATGYRARTIARTESVRALNQGQVSSWREVGIKQKQWSISPGACQFCETIGEYRTVQPIDGFFATLGETLQGTEGGRMRISYRNVSEPGLHPNCRCTLLAVLP